MEAVGGLDCRGREVWGGGDEVTVLFLWVVEGVACSVVLIVVAVVVVNVPVVDVRWREVRRWRRYR